MYTYTQPHALAHAMATAHTFACGLRVLSLAWRGSAGHVLAMVTLYEALLGDTRFRERIVCVDNQGPWRWCDCARRLRLFLRMHACLASASLPSLASKRTPRANAQTRGMNFRGSPEPRLAHPCPVAHLLRPVAARVQGAST